MKRDKKMKIGLIGLDFCSDNLGCGALSYSFLHILDYIAQKNGTEVSICVFTQEKCRIDPCFSPNIKEVEVTEYHLKDIPSMIHFWRKVKECSVTYDFTSGDSFSDIYGITRVAKSEFMKTVILLSRTKLVLGPQTYGPFANPFLRNWAAWILRHAETVYARDDISADYVQKISGVNPTRAVDVAFILPYQCEQQKTSSPLRVGVNISGLLWNGGYTKDNQFHLQVDYQSYCTALISWLKSINVQVHLIGHVLCTTLPVEDDLQAAEQLNKLCDGYCIIAPRFRTPMEAKSYISQMDVFIGARMHSTIAAISSGCATIPFAYSRKFKGLYHTLEYPYVIEASEMETDEAVQLTKEWISQRAKLTQNAYSANTIAQNKIDAFIYDVEKKLLVKSQHFSEES